ncbi:hypothetical protein WMW72_17400 [Paenibacillus filicis]|uniref:DUF4190 domain-containing protein n=1 Tax=Paenibacillus filicis TaxID=669464 RepID=A0ABU9DLF5_9BACL
MKRKLGGQASSSPGMTRSEAALHRYKLQQLHRETGGRGKEEFAAEAGFAGYQTPVWRESDERNDSQRKRKKGELLRAGEGRSQLEQYSSAAQWPGYVALLLSALALFIYPAALAAAGSVLAVFAYWQGQRKLGAWALVIGLLALGGYLILLPFYS